MVFYFDGPKLTSSLRYIGLFAIRISLEMRYCDEKSTIFERI